MARADLLHLLAHTIDYGLVAQVVDDVAHPARQRAALVFLEAPGGDGGRADPDAAGDEWRLRVIGHGVLVHRNVRLSQRSINFLARQLLGDEVDQEQVVVGSAGNDLVVALDEHLGHGLGVGQHLKPGTP